MRANLSRPHPFAAEWVGFLYGRLASAGADSALVLMTGYEPVADERYINDPWSGARIDSQAIRGAMQGVLDRGQCGFHVRMHHWPGRPILSRVDAEEIPSVVTGLRRVGLVHAHGIVPLHQEECAPGCGCLETTTRSRRIRSPWSAFLSRSSAERAVNDERFSRQSFLGEHCQDAIERAVVGVVGLGGGGHVCSNSPTSGS